MTAIIPVTIPTPSGPQTLAMVDIGNGVLAQVAILYYDGALMSEANPQAIVEHRSNAAVVTAVAVGTESTQLLGNNHDRHSAIFHNEGTTDIYLKFGDDCSISSYSLMLRAGRAYVLDSPFWTRTVTACRASGSGNVLVTELATQGDI